MGGRRRGLSTNERARYVCTVHRAFFSACVSFLSGGKNRSGGGWTPQVVVDRCQTVTDAEARPNNHHRKQRQQLVVTQGDGERSGICFSLRGWVLSPSDCAEMRPSAGRDSSRLADKADGIRPSASDAVSVSFRPGCLGMGWGWDGGSMNRILCDRNSALCQRKARQLKRKRETRWNQDAVEKETHP